MTDQEALFTYRMRQAQETLSDAEKMLEAKTTPRSIINRAYYAMFYAALALFLKSDIKLTSSKHSAVLSTFDVEFVRPGKIDKSYSQIFHNAFEERNEVDYQEDASYSFEDARQHVANAQKFVSFLQSVVKNQ